MGEIQYLENLDVTLHWEKWVPWHTIKRYVQQRRLPNLTPKAPGVYEAKFSDQVERLHIGETGTGVNGTLHQRIRAFVRGNSDHSAGHRIEQCQGKGLINVSNIVVRWAVTEQHIEVQGELHRIHRVKYGRLPKYTEQT